MEIEDDFAGGQDVGARESQEDSYAFSSPEDVQDELLMVLCDGAGGHAHGAVASQSGVETFTNGYWQAEGAVDHRLRQGLEVANEEMERQRHVLGAHDYLVTTLVAVALVGKQCHWISIGDSPLFKIRGESIVQLNEDHSYRNLVDLPDEEAEFAGTSGLRFALTGERIQHFDQSEFVGDTLDPGDIILCASDGVRCLTDEELLAIATGSQSAREIVDGVLSNVLSRDAAMQDNVTITVCRA